MTKIIQFFDKLEDKIRGKLSHYPILYAIIGGVGVVLFWRGVWHIADDLNVGSIVSLLAGTFFLLMTGVFVSAFIGSRLIISGLSGEKKLTEKAKDEIETEEDQIRRLQSTLNKVEKGIANIESKLK